MRSVELTLDLDDFDSETDCLFFDVGEVDRFCVYFGLNLLLGAVLFGVFHVEWNHEALLDEIDLAWFVEVECLSDPLLDEFFILNVIKRRMYLLLFRFYLILRSRALSLPIRNHQRLLSKCQVF